MPCVRWPSVTSPPSTKGRPSMPVSTPDEGRDVTTVFKLSPSGSSLCNVMTLLPGVGSRPLSQNHANLSRAGWGGCLRGATQAYEACAVWVHIPPISRTRRYNSDHRPSPPIVWQKGKMGASYSKGAFPAFQKRQVDAPHGKGAFTAFQKREAGAPQGQGSHSHLPKKGRRMPHMAREPFPPSKKGRRVPHIAREPYAPSNKGEVDAPHGKGAFPTFKKKGGGWPAWQGGLSHLQLKGIEMAPKAFGGASHLGSAAPRVRFGRPRTPPITLPTTPRGHSRSSRWPETLA